jgi:hypothetical protein
MKLTEEQIEDIVEAVEEIAMDAVDRRFNSQSWPRGSEMLRVALDKLNESEA